jgi:hypothetical protein
MAVRVRNFMTQRLAIYEKFTQDKAILSNPLTSSLSPTGRGRR